MLPIECFFFFLVSVEDSKLFWCLYLLRPRYLIRYLSVTILASQSRTHSGLAPVPPIAKNPKFIQPSQALDHVSLLFVRIHRSSAPTLPPANIVRELPTIQLRAELQHCSTATQTFLRTQTAGGARPYGVNGDRAFIAALVREKEAARPPIPASHRQCPSRP